MEIGGLVGVTGEFVPEETARERVCEAEGTEHCDVVISRISRCRIGDVRFEKNGTGQSIRLGGRESLSPRPPLTTEHQHSETPNSSLHHKTHTKLGISGAILTRIHLQATNLNNIIPRTGPPKCPTHSPSSPPPTPPSSPTNSAPRAPAATEYHASHPPNGPSSPSSCTPRST